MCVLRSQAVSVQEVAKEGREVRTAIASHVVIVEEASCRSTRDEDITQALLAVVLQCVKEEDTSLWKQGLNEFPRGLA